MEPVITGKHKVPARTLDKNRLLWLLGIRIQRVKSSVGTYMYTPAWHGRWGHPGSQRAEGTTQRKDGERCRKLCVWSARAQPWWRCGEIVISVLKNNPGNRALTPQGQTEKLKVREVRRLIKYYTSIILILGFLI